MARRPKKPVESVPAAPDTLDDIAERGGLSPNRATNLIVTDLLLRGGGRLLKNAVERAVLGTSVSAGKAKTIVKGRSMTQTLVSTALARIATRSVPGAIIVGGGMVAKTLYDRRKGRKAAQAGEKSTDKLSRRGRRD